MIEVERRGAGGEEEEAYLDGLHFELSLFVWLVG
jgi:hypothetical protein